MENIVAHRLVSADSNELPMFVPSQLPSDTSMIKFDKESMNLRRLGSNFARLAIVEVLPLLPNALVKDVTRHIKSSVDNTLFVYPIQLERFSHRFVLKQVLFAELLLIVDL